MIPTHIVTGFLGVGKTTAILDAFRFRPENERWAVLVNEFGAVGIDGAVLGGPGDVAIREIAGGCICCSAGGALRMSLVKLIREVRPDRLWIEPTGLAHPATVVDMVRSPGLGLDARAVITLVDPRRLADARVLADPVFRDQVQIADVLVANFSDRATDEDLAAFARFADEAWPKKLAVGTTSEGRLDPAWLELRPQSTLRFFSPQATDMSHWGWGEIWPPTVQFSFAALQQTLQTLVRPNEGLPSGVERLKGIFRTERGWHLVQASSDQMRWSAIGHRRDSRVEVLAAMPGATPEWMAAQFQAAISTGS